MTTVALDFGEIDLPGEEPVRLYGVPGQERFDFLWPMVADGSIGALFLVDATDPNHLDTLDGYLDNFSRLVARVPSLVVLTKTDIAPATLRPNAVQQHLEERGLQLAVVEADMRDKRNVLYLLHLLLTLIENEPTGGH